MRPLVHRGHPTAVLPGLFVFASVLLGCSDCYDSFESRTAMRVLEFPPGEDELLVRVQFTGDFALLAVSGSVTVRGASGKELPSAPFIGVFPDFELGSSSGGSSSRDVDRDELPYEDCEYHAHNRYESMGHRETVVCLEGSTDQEVVLIREPDGPQAVTVTAQVLANITYCEVTPEAVYGVQLQAVD